MFLKILEITPTSPLTFRKVPLSHKIIDSYEFVPPTTLSGFLYRLLKLANGEELPEPKKFKSEDPVISEYHILETKEETKDIFSLGAYPHTPNHSASFTSFRMGYQHLGKGHSLGDGLDIFDPSYDEVIDLINLKIKKGELNESQLEKFKKEYEKSKENKLYKKGVYKLLFLGHDMIPTWDTFDKEERRQPLDWSYCCVGKFHGFLVSERKDSLDLFNRVYNYGFKIGKEGFAYVSEVFPTAELEIKEGEFVSSVIVPTISDGIKLKEISGVESVYYLDLDTQRFAKDVFALNGSLAEGRFYTAKINGININIPAVTLKILTGGLYG